MAMNINNPVSGHSLLSAQWNHSANKSSMDEISIYSTEKCHWICKKCGYTWEEAPRKREKTKCRCPHCEDHKAAMPGVDDILTVQPDVVRYYNYEKNKDHLEEYIP